MWPYVQPLTNIVQAETGNTIIWYIFSLFLMWNHSIVQSQSTSAVLRLRLSIKSHIWLFVVVFFYSQIGADLDKRNHTATQPHRSTRLWGCQRDSGELCFWGERSERQREMKYEPCSKPSPSTQCTCGNWCGLFLQKKRKRKKEHIKGLWWAASVLPVRPPLTRSPL